MYMAVAYSRIKFFFFFRTKSPVYYLILEYYLRCYQCQAKPGSHNRRTMTHFKQRTDITHVPHLTKQLMQHHLESKLD